MKAFTHLDAIAAALPVANVDTDKIIPARFLKTVSRTGLGAALFNDMRYDADGTPKANFVLNRSPWDGAGVLVAGDNFGCGSSREHAPWALLDFGITCIIAPSFADIFYNNCFKNGILPIVQDEAVCGRLIKLAADPATATFAVDLNEQIITLPDGNTLGFEIDAARRDALLTGRDDITTSLERSDAIAEFESDAAFSWLPAITVDLTCATGARSAARLEEEIA